MSKWETKKLGLIIKRLGIKHVSAERLNDIALPYGNIKLLSTGNFDGYTIPELANGYVYNNEVITLPTGGSANIKYYNGSFVDSGNIVFITNKNYSTKFVYYSMMKDISYFENCYRGSSIKHPEMKDVYSHLIKTPTHIIEADKIAEVLASVDENIEQTKSIIEKYKNIKLGMMQDFFNFLNIKKGWLMQPLGKVARIRKGTSFTSAEIEIGDFPIVAGGITYAGYHSRFNRDENCITISASGANAGFVSIHFTKIFATDCSTIEWKGSQLFLYYFLLNKQQVIFNMQTGLAQPHIYPKDIAKINFYYPKEIDMQNEISKQLVAIDNKIENEQEYLDKLLKLKQGLMQDLLTSKVSVLPLMKKEV
jgi:type I restriction enzyme S subunit